MSYKGHFLTAVWVIGFSLMPGPVGGVTCAVWGCLATVQKHGGHSQARCSVRRWGWWCRPGVVVALWTEHLDGWGRGIVWAPWWDLVSKNRPTNNQKPKPKWHISIVRIAPNNRKGCTLFVLWAYFININIYFKAKILLHFSVIQEEFFLPVVNAHFP